MPVIGKPSTPLALQEFSLISFDKFGYRQPLPPGLADLPLYLDDDGYFSVNGSLDFTHFSPHTALAPISDDSHFTIRRLITDVPDFSGENPHVTPAPHSGRLDADPISRLATPPLFYTAYYFFHSNGFPVGPKHVLRRGAIWLHLEIFIPNKAGIGPPPRSEAPRQTRRLSDSGMREGWR